MLHIGITANKKKRLLAGVFAVVSAFLLFQFPGALRASLFGLPVPMAYLVPALVLGAVVALLVEVRSAPILLRLIAKLLLLVCSIFMLLYATELLSGGDLLSLLQSNSASFFLGYLLLAALIASAYGLIGSMPWALRLVTFLVMLYSFVGYFVLKFRGTPLLPEDIAAANTALVVLPNYKFELTQPLAEGLLIFLSIFLLSAKTKLPAMRALFSGLLRLGFLVLALAFLLANITKARFYERGLTPHYWDQSITALSNGSFVNFAANIPDLILSPPEGYSPKVVQEIAAGYSSDAADSAQIKPDVILVMGESWADMAPEGLTKTNTPDIPFLSSFKTREDGIYRDLLVSTYGGGTSRSEFQVLTGTSVQYGVHHAPFQFNVKEPLPNLVASFKQLGYETTAMHSGELGAWGRDKAFPLLGFDRFIDETDIGEPDSKMSRYYLSDEALYKKALAQLDSAAPDQPQFVYAITIQTHGGYEYEYYDSEVHIEEPAGDFPATEQYLDLMHDSDADFQYLIEALEQRERPTIVLAYGDHLPLVDSAYMQDVKHAWQEQPDNADAASVWDYKTFYVMWANFPLPEDIKNQPPYAGLNLLGTYLMHSAGLPLTGYQKFLLESAQQFSAVSVAGYMNPEGHFMSPAAISSEDLYFQQAVLQYNLMKDQDNAPSDFFYLK